MTLQQQDEFQELKRSLKLLEKSDLKCYTEQESRKNEKNKNDNFDIQLIDNKIIQPEPCRAISFNNSNQIMISTSNSIIRVFRFSNSIIEEICQLDGHSMNVYVLIFSKLSNSFISGSADSSIRCWQQTEPTQWKSSKPYKQHSGYIECAIINQKENLLFSAGEDKIIYIWKLNLIKNYLEYQTQLIQHQGKIDALSLNQSETFLVSFGYDKRIIIWKKEGNDWIFNHIVKQSIYENGYRVKFLRDELFLWVATKSFVYFFELNKGVFQEKNDKAIELQKNHLFDTFLFPILHNPNQNLIIIRHKNFIYIIRETQDNQFQIVKSISCQWNRVSGTITNDGQFLVFWDCKEVKKNESSNGSYFVYRLSVN
ncbi:unnamed protein product [Paramecium pentaurelia]|uniref:Uncharacterized protein n=1 Tax=Paramecium pentaurelia TaxID=43138 RepID=A0A8S1U4Z6_9CILI|nr:unnamed protein product [Paramecium pentaurelia]